MASDGDIMIARLHHSWHRNATENLIWKLSFMTLQPLRDMSTRESDVVHKNLALFIARIATWFRTLMLAARL